MTRSNVARKKWEASLKLLLLSSLLVVVLWFGLLQWVMMSYRSIAVSATLVSADRVSSTIKSGGGKLLLDYRYSYLGVSYIGDQAAFGSRWMRHSASSDMDMQREVGRLSRQNSPQLIDIRVDPDNPHESALLKRAHPGLMYITSFFGLALLIGVINAVFQLRKLVPQPNPRPFKNID